MPGPDYRKPAKGRGAYDHRHLREEISDRKEALMATYHVSVIIEIPDDSDDEENEVEQAVRDLAAEHMWRVLSLTVLA